MDKNAQPVRRLALVSLNLKQSGSCALNFCECKSNVSDRKQTLVKNEVRTKTTKLIGLDCAFNALFSIRFVESELVGLMCTQSLCM